MANAVMNKASADGWLGMPSRRWVWGIYAMIGAAPVLVLLSLTLWTHFAFLAPGGASCWTELDVSYATPLESGLMAALLYAGPWLFGILIACVAFWLMKQPTLRPTLAVLAFGASAVALLVALQQLNQDYLSALQQACATTR